MRLGNFNAGHPTRHYLLRRGCEQRHRLVIIFWHTVAIPVHEAEGALRPDEPLSSRGVAEDQRFLVIAVGAFVDAADLAWSAANV